ncbi:MAG: 23S rRNA (adenine(2503)-C(2))-methyltransferase RlmN, partial [Candidatus Izimaplasma sp.]|nr:23S rRNA (adenine(2503)-C(2))-methyltransferase RlmN [Candidatus Izimaplasma bacterium]
MEKIYDYTLSELAEMLVEFGFKKFNARQVFEWIYKKNVTEFENMSNLSKTLRAFLVENFIFSTLEVNSHQISRDGTEKFLFELEDHNLIETVLMRHDYGNSVCVTTQLGCNIGCSFCASGLQKKIRDLQAYEIVLQVLKVANITKERVSHVVVMGIGEPFDNYDNAMKFIDIINSPYGLEIGARHITVSTSGIVPKIEQFSLEIKQVNLAISLHAPNNEIRTKLMKINKVYPIEEVIRASKDYVELTNRRITFEYLLLDHINDELKHANELSDLLRGINCYVNLIRYNNVKEFDLKGSSEARANTFYLKLKSRGINTTLRREKGGDIDAACGQ